MSTTTNQQFEGSTIEEALAAAVDALGDDLEILDAQKVKRRRMLGVGKKERFEVIAAKPSLAEPRDFEDVLKRMVARVDHAEREVAGPTRPDEREWWRSADFVVPDQPQRQPAMAGAVASSHPQAARQPPEPQHPAADLEIELDVRREPARATTGSMSVADQARQLVEQSIGQPPPADPPPPVVTQPTITVEVDAPAWSHEALLELDLPSALVTRITPADPDHDLDWVAATAKSIGELLDTAQAVSGPCELTGHGAEAAVHLIRGACDGFRLDSLIIDGRRVPATPLELALAIRSLLREQP